MRTAYARSVPSFLAACALLCCTTLPALAAAWKPEENLEIVVAGGPGGGTDQLARLVQSAISQNKLLDVNTGSCRDKGKLGHSGSILLI
nr:hypothetical protein [Pseudomonas aeruginosa]